MKNYKPEYLGKLINANDPKWTMDFMKNKYDSFSKLYDVCCDESDNISDIGLVKYDPTDTSLNVIIDAPQSTLDKLSSLLVDGMNINDNVLSIK